MTVSSRGIALMIGLLALALAGGARAQENLDEGKTPAQLYASDCAICHKTTRGMQAKVGGFGGLEGFLREHYTSSRKSAGIIARYVRETDSGPLPAAGRHTARPRHEEHHGPGEKKEKSAATKSSKPGAKEKSAEKKSHKSGEAKSSENKTSEKKTTKKKPHEAKTTEKPPKETKASEKKPAEKEAMSKPAKPKKKEKASDAEASAPKSSDKASDKPESPKDAKPAQ